MFATGDLHEAVTQTEEIPHSLRGNPSSSLTIAILNDNKL